MPRTLRRVLIVIAITAASVPVSLAAATAASAGTGIPCFENLCSGLDPANSYQKSTLKECSAGAYTVGSVPAFGGTLELRWGPNCYTNWTRFTPANNDSYAIDVIREADGLWAGNGLYNYYVFSNARGVSHYSDQVYSPGPAAACVIDLTVSDNVCYGQ